MIINIIIYFLCAIPAITITVPFYILRELSEFMIRMNNKFFDWWTDKCMN